MTDNLVPMPTGEGVTGHMARAAALVINVVVATLVATASVALLVAILAVVTAVFGGRP